MNRWTWASTELKRKRPLRVPDRQSFFAIARRVAPDGIENLWITANGEPIYGASSLDDVLDKLPSRVTELHLSCGETRVQFSTGRGAATTAWSAGDSYALGAIVAVIEQNSVPLARLTWLRRRLPWANPELAVSLSTRDALEQRAEARRIAWIGGITGILGGVLGGAATSVVAVLLAR